MTQIPQNVMILPIEQSVRSSNWWLNKFPEHPRIIDISHPGDKTTTTRIVYRCDYCNLPITAAFCFPQRIFTDKRAGNNVALHGRFKDYACMYSWMMNNKKPLGKERLEIMLEWLHEECGSDEFVRAPSSVLLRVNGGRMTESEWCDLYAKGNLQFQKTLQRPHIFAEAELAIRKKTNTTSINPSMSALISEPVDIVGLGDRVVRDALASIETVQTQLNILPRTDVPEKIIGTVHNSTSSQPPRRNPKKRRMDIDGQPINPPKKAKARKPAPSLTSFSDFMSQPPTINGPVPNRPIQRKKPSTPTALPSIPNGSKDPVAAAKAALEKVIAEEKKKKAAMVGQSGIPLSTTSSSSSSSSSGAKPPGNKRTLIVQKGNKKVEQQSHDFYHDLTKMIITDANFDCQTIVKAALVTVDKNGIMRVTPISNKHDVSVNLRQQ